MESRPGGYLRKVLSSDGNVVVVSVDATGVAEELLARQGLMPPSMLHLGQACLGALLLQGLSDASDNQKVELQWSVEGPFGNLYAEVLGTGRVRGMIVCPEAVVSRLDEPLGTGILQVRRSTPPLADYTGIVPSSGHVGGDLVEYLERSEQRACGVSLSVQVVPTDDPEKPFRVQRAVGYLVHVLPQNTEARQLELLSIWHRFMEDLGPLSKWALETTSSEATTEALLRFLFPTGGEKLLYAGNVRFDCTCSEERAGRALALMQRQEAVEGQSPSSRLVTVTCEFCGRKYGLTEGPTDSN